ncbi:MAG TPA: hypothetical protein VGM86_11895 [Thermoanaerobaculia bacterium]|jgi:hypothetical protein
MKKKMERLSGELFRPLTPAEQKWISGSAIPRTETAVTLYETYNTSTGVGDTVRDGDNE